MEQVWTAAPLNTTHKSSTTGKVIVLVHQVGTDSVALETLCQVGPVLIWTLRISSGVSEGVYKLVEQSNREFLNIGVGDRQ